jgi:hypothetical protein
MNKNVAKIDKDQKVIQVNSESEDYVLKDDEILVLNVAYVGGFYIDGYFYPPKPYESWIMSNGKWISPIPMPETNKMCIWDENNQKWITN